MTTVRSMQLYFFYYIHRPGGGCDRSVIHSFCPSVNRITDERGNGCRPNLAGMGKCLTFDGDPVPRLNSRSLFHFLHHCEIGDLSIFVSISHTINSRFVPYLAK